MFFIVDALFVGEISRPDAATVLVATLRLGVVDGGA